MDACVECVDPPINYYSISRLQGLTFNPRLSVSLHQLSGTLCLHLLKVPPPSPHSRHAWKQNCLLQHTTQSNISSAAGASDSNSWHMAPPINVFDIWHLWLKKHIFPSGAEMPVITDPKRIMTCGGPLRWCMFSHGFGLEKTMYGSLCMPISVVFSYAS